MSDLIERLRKSGPGYQHHEDLIAEAADALTASEARAARLSEALEEVVRLDRQTFRMEAGDGTYKVVERDGTVGGIARAALAETDERR